MAGWGRDELRASREDSYWWLEMPRDLAFLPREGLRELGVWGHRSAAF